jgi:hypothetical protein
MEIKYIYDFMMGINTDMREGTIDRIQKEETQMNT